MRGLRVLLLGQGRLELDGQPLTRLMAAKHQALVYHLAASGEPAPRSRLAALLWSGHDEAAARANLRLALTRLRRWLPGMLDIDERQVGLAADATVWVDWHEVGAALRADAPLAAREAAARLWRGPLLDGLDIAGSDEFERWLAQMRQRAQRDMLALRRGLLQQHEDDGALDAAIEWARGLLEIDEADEPAHMALMRLLAARGRRTAALAQYEACRAALAERLGARPSAVCYALYTRIHGEAGAPVSAPPPPRAASAPPRVAPVPEAPGRQAASESVARHRGALHGREAEMALIAERLTDAECRWLTITGPGGVGKTRLAEAAASELGPRFRHGMLWFSGRDSAGMLRDHESLLQQVLDHVGSDHQDGGALLLVLDNLETVPAAGALAGLLAQRLPGAVVLATSRTRIGGAREWLLELGGLSLARAAGGAPASSPAARLFAACARRLVPDVDAAADAAAIECICERVGGLPLALEMAARAVHHAGTAAVAQRLAAGPGLADPDRDPQDRHRSIAAVLEDSWALLPASVREAAVRLAWLAAEFDPALAAVAGVPAATLAALREHSWLSRAGPDRLALHPLQQDFLRRQPEAQSLADAVRAAVLRRLQAVLPPVPPFGHLDRPLPAGHPALGAVTSAPVLADAAGLACTTAGAATLAPWIDSAVALLLQCDRPGEAAALLARACQRSDLPNWRTTGWVLRRGEILNLNGDTVGGLQAVGQGLQQLGLTLAHAGIDRVPLSAWPRDLVWVLRLPGWPARGEAARAALRQLVLRCLSQAAQALSFTPEPQPMVRASVLAGLLARRDGDRADRASTTVMSAWGATLFGRPRVAALLARRSARRPPIRHDERQEVSAAEGQAAVALVLGRWAGLAERLDELAERARLLCCHRMTMECRSLAAKLAFYEGRLDDAWHRFTSLSEAGLRQPGDAWRAWGPLGQAETAWCLGRDETTVQRLFEHGSAAMTEMAMIDGAYTLRRLGLAARLAWRCGAADAARSATLAGVDAAARMRHCGFWGHEGLAGIAETLLALRVHERGHGGALPPLDAAWRRLEPALTAHVRRFPPAASLYERLRGQRALDDGNTQAAGAALQRAVKRAEQQGMRVELARACQALECVDGRAGWGDRADRLWQQMRLQPASQPSC